MSGQRFAARMSAVALVLTVALAPVHHARGQVPSEAAGATLSVVAETTASVDLHLPDGLTIIRPAPLQPPPGVTINGAGRVVGVAIRSLGANTTTELSLMRWNRCDEEGCSSDEEPSYSVAGGQAGVSGGRATHTLPAGRYRAYIVTDGAPVTVTLGLPGRARSRQVTATGPASAIVDSPAMTAPPGGLHQAGGTSGAFGPGAGTIIQYMEAETQSTSAGHRTHCVYPGDGPPAGTYLARCPGGNSINSLSTHTSGPGQTERMYTAWWGLGQGKYHAGTVLLRTHPPADVLAVHVFLEYL